MIDLKRIKNALKVVKHPKLQKAYIDLGMVSNIIIDGETVKLTLALKSTHGPLLEKIKREIENVLLPLDGVSEVEIEVTALSQGKIDKLFPKPHYKGIEKVRNFLAIASGKGGVGKTTVAVNIALGLVKNGHKVGLLDADIYGPSIPMMLGLTEPLEQEEGMIIPSEKFGLRIVSMGMTAGQDEAFIWRGPIVAKMIRQLLGQVKWGDLDYLVIDLPPGTGDPSITVAQALPQASILMVTTPQEVSLADVRRAVTLFKKHDLCIVGLVENMSYFVCGHSAQPIEIFGHGGGEKLSQETGIPLLGNIPIDLELRQGGDTGVPLMVSKPDSEVGQIFQKAAKALAEKIDNPT